MGDVDGARLTCTWGGLKVARSEFLLPEHHQPKRAGAEAQTPPASSLLSECVVGLGLGIKFKGMQSNSSNGDKSVLMQCI